MSENEHVKKLAAMDQATSALVDTFPTMWRGVYTNLLEQNFTEEEAFKLLQIFILSNAPNGVHFS